MNDSTQSTVESGNKGSSGIPIIIVAVIGLIVVILIGLIVKEKRKK
jgi:hypothetical protein